MRRLILSIALLGLTAGAAMADKAPFGEPLAGLDPTPIEKILAAPDEFDGAEVRIEGEVAGVCQNRGCWIDLVSPTDAKLRVKVEDGVIVFPASAVGAQAIAEGTVEIVDMDREAYASWREHVAQEEGREFDAAEIGDGPYRIVQLRGRGAEIESLP